MKKYMYCFLLFIVSCITCLSIGFFTTRHYVKQERPVPNAVYETESLPEDQVVVNRDEIEPVAETKAAARFYLVSENGYLLVFCEDKVTVYLYTNMPLMDFPPKEQEKLREGIWFSDMMDVFNYLESYTS